MTGLQDQQRINELPPPPPPSPLNLPLSHPCISPALSLPSTFTYVHAFYLSPCTSGGGPSGQLIATSGPAQRARGPSYKPWRGPAGPRGRGPVAGMQGFFRCMVKLQTNFVHGVLMEEIVNDIKKFIVPDKCLTVIELSSLHHAQ